MAPKIFGLSFDDGSGAYGLVELATYRLTCALCPWRGETEAWRGVDDPEPRYLGSHRRPLLPELREPGDIRGGEK